jgi:hypothetical protein
MKKSPEQRHVDRSNKISNREKRNKNELSGQKVLQNGQQIEMED